MVWRGTDILLQCSVQKDPFEILLFSLLIWWVTLIYFWMVNSSCIPGKIPIIYSLFFICWTLLTSTLLHIFIYRRCWSVVFFSCICLRLMLGQSWPYKRSWELFPPSLFSEKVWIGIVYAVSVWQGFCDVIWPEFSLREDFYYKFIYICSYRTIQILYFSGENFGSLCILKICPIYLR